MDVILKSPICAAAHSWRSSHGASTLTIVCKATFSLLPGTSTLHTRQDEINDEDTYWDDDPRRSLSLASDMVPFKRCADVVLVGNAYAPGQVPVRSMIARLLVGEIDKAVEVFCDRALTLDGQIHEGPRVVKVPIRYERAAGGPDTWNPVGVRHDAPPDIHGLAPLPNIQPVGLHIDRRDLVIDPVGFGPIAPTWPHRAERISHIAGAWTHTHWYAEPLPEGLDPAFFNVAPRDQQISHLRNDERIVLENLHPDHPRLVTNLPGVRPRASVEREGGGREEIGLVCDTLWIDTSRQLCSLVWRGWLALSHPHEAGRVVVWLDDLGHRETTVHAVVQELDAQEIDETSEALLLETSDVFLLDREKPAVHTAEISLKPLKAALPFLAAAPAIDPPEPTQALPMAPQRAEPFVPQAAGSERVLEPPMIGPLATPEMVARAESEAAPVQSPAPDTPRAAPEPDVAPTASPAPIDFPIERCAAIAAEIAQMRPQTEQILKSHDLTPDRWKAIEEHWVDKLRKEASRGTSMLLKAYDEGYVAQIEQLRGPIQVDEYARLVVGSERGSTPAVIKELRLPRGAVLRIERVWLDRVADDPVLARSVRAALAAARKA